MFAESSDDANEAHETIHAKKFEEKMKLKISSKINLVRKKKFGLEFLVVPRCILLHTPCNALDSAPFNPKKHVFRTNLLIDALSVQPIGNDTHRHDRAGK